MVSSVALGGVTSGGHAITCKRTKNTFFNEIRGLLLDLEAEGRNVETKYLM